MVKNHILLFELKLPFKTALCFRLLEYLHIYNFRICVLNLLQFFFFFTFYFVLDDDCTLCFEDVNISSGPPGIPGLPGAPGASCGTLIQGLTGDRGPTGFPGHPGLAGL